MSNNILKVMLLLEVVERKKSLLFSNIFFLTVFTPLLLRLIPRVPPSSIVDTLEGRKKNGGVTSRSTSSAQPTLRALPDLRSLKASRP